MDGTLNTVLPALRVIFGWVWNHRQLMLAGLALLLYLVSLGRPPLWEPDEGRYAEIAREMVASHDYITPRNDYVRYFEKPPLVYWVTAASLKLLGRNEFAVRLQAAMASVGQVVITGALGERMFGATTGVVAGLALALSPLFFAFARFATPDPALAFFITGAMACFYIGVRSCDLSSRVQNRWVLAATAMLAAGTLTKGPVALLLGGTIAVLWLMLEGRGHTLFRLPWLKCVGVYLSVSLPWFIVVARRNPGFVRFFIIHEHFQRYLESTEHGWGPWFYIPISIAGTWPWFYFVPFAFVRASSVSASLRSFWPFAKTRNKSLAFNNCSPCPHIDSEDEHARAALQFLAIWYAVVLIFFSIPRSKLGEYILPGLPPIGILSAYGLARIKALATLQRQRVFLIFAAINAAAATAIMALTIALPANAFTDSLIGDARIIAGTLLVVGITPVVFATRATGTITLVLASSVIIEMGAAMNARERVAQFVSYRGLANIIAPYTNSGCRLMSYRHFEQALPFYTGARETLVNYRGELQPFGPLYDPSASVFATLPQLQEAWAGKQCVLLVVNRLDLLTLAKLLSPAPILIGCEGKKAVVSNHGVPTSVQGPSAASGCNIL
jgi:4-amino-4-deoxy-L-arabinose transferase-like glycosyltransferase